MSVLRPYLKTNEVAVDRDVMVTWINDLHRVGRKIWNPKDVLPIKNDMELILGQPRWTDKQSLTVEGDAALDELARHGATIAVPVGTLRDWKNVVLNVLSAGDQEDEIAAGDKLAELADTLVALLSTSAENGPGSE